VTVPRIPATPATVHLFHDILCFPSIELPASPLDGAGPKKRRGRVLKLFLTLAAVSIAAASPPLAQSRSGKALAVAKALTGNKGRPGLGDDPGVPIATPLALPTGISIDGPIVGADADGGECRARVRRSGAGGASRSAQPSA